MLGTVIDPTAPYPTPGQQQQPTEPLVLVTDFTPTPGVVERMEDLDCGFLQSVRGRPLSEGSGYYCASPGPKELLWGLALAPVMVPLSIVDGIISGRPAKRWLTPQPTDKSFLNQNLGFAGVHVMVGAGLLSLYLWYRIYKSVKGGK